MVLSQLFISFAVLDYYN